MQFGGTPLRAVVKAIAEDRLATCAQIEEEVVAVLTLKFSWERGRVRDDLAFYWRDAFWAEPKGTSEGLCRDPDDEIILQCAELAGAQRIVSGDNDLLSLGTYNGIAIITARQYIEEDRL